MESRKSARGKFGARVGRHRWLALSIGLVGALVLAEILARLYVAWSGLVVAESDESNWPRSFTDHTAAYVETYSMVEGGMRYTCGKATAETPYRLAIVGDSFAYGAGVPDCADFPSLVNIARPDVVVSNFGRPGAGFDEYLEITEEKVCGAQFDGVLLLICGNDFLGVQDGLLERAASYSRLAGLASALMERTSPDNFAKQFLTKLGLAGPLPPGTPLPLTYRQMTVEPSGGGRRVLVKLLEDLSISREFALHTSEPPDDLLESNLELLDKLMDRTRGCTRDIWVAVVPNGATYSAQQREFIASFGGILPPEGKPSIIEQKVRAVAEECGVNFIETDSSFAPEADEAYYVSDFHWTVAGHRIMAGRVLNALAKLPRL